MWAEAFGTLGNERKTLDSALLKARVLPSHTDIHARASAVIAAHLAAIAKTKPQRFILMIPPPATNDAYIACCGLLLADCSHRHVEPALSRRPTPLLNGDLLMVTHAVGDSLEKFRTLRLGGLSLDDIWLIDSFSRYRPAPGEKARIFVANAGWLLDEEPPGPMAAVVIDATHPRTALRLPRIARALVSIPLQIFVTLPFLEKELAEIGLLDPENVWLWDPEAQRAVARAVSGSPGPEITEYKRNLWVCAEPQMDNILAELHDLLAALQRSADAGPPVWEAWSLYHRLRQLAVPLPQLEDNSHLTWGAIPLLKRLERLQRETPNAIEVAASWPSLLDGLRKAYETLLHLDYPPKFWALAERMEAHLQETSEPIRVVTPSEREAAMLAVNLGYTVDGWSAAQKSGRVEIVGAREEARRISAGDMRPTLLLGNRVGSHRHFDLYPAYDTHIIVYPYEAEVDRMQQKRIYDFAETLQEGERRKIVLAKLGLHVSGPVVSLRSRRPAFATLGTIERTARPVHSFLYDPSAMDLDRLAGTGLPEEWHEDARTDPAERDEASRDHQQTVVVRFEGGRTIRYAEWQSVDVYHPATQLIRRYRASELRAGMRVILLVDSVYDNLFERFVEALRSRIGPYAMMSLNLWDQAKAELLRKHCGNRTALYTRLAERGVSIGYAAVRMLFTDNRLSLQLALGFTTDDDTHEAETLAPQQYADMKVLAEYSGLFPNESAIRVTFGAIQEERGRRRRAGHSLRDWLRALAAGEGFDKAMANARELGSEVAEVIAALDVRQVEGVSIQTPVGVNSQ